MGKVESDLCNFCNETKDSFEHYIWNCNIAKLFWKEIQSLLNQILGINMQLTKEVVLFGNNYDNVIRDKNLSQLVNFIILLAKYHLHCCKWTKKSPNNTTFLHVLEQREKIEKEIAFQNNKLEQHNKKWQKLKPLLMSE